MGFSLFMKKIKKNIKKCLTMLYCCAIISESLGYDGRNGSIAQLGEHLPYKQRVIGSSPIVSTIFYNRGQKSLVQEYEWGIPQSFQMRPGSSVG